MELYFPLRCGYAEFSWPWQWGKLLQFCEGMANIIYCTGRSSGIQRSTCCAAFLAGLACSCSVPGGTSCNHFFFRKLVIAICWAVTTGCLRLVIPTSRTPRTEQGDLCFFLLLAMAEAWSLRMSCKSQVFPLHWKGKKLKCGLMMAEIRINDNSDFVAHRHLEPVGTGWNAGHVQ